MKSKLGQVVKYILMLGIGVLLMALAMRAVEDAQALWDDMRRAG